MVRFSLSLFLVAAALAQEQQGPIMQAITPRFQTARMNLVEAAELMPEEAYGYQLTPAQRSFAGWIEHNIQMNYGSCSSIHSAPAPDAAKKYHGVTSKPDLLAGLKASFDYCQAAFSGFTDATAVQPRTVAGRPVSPVNVMFGLVVNWNQHYGNLVGYLRTKGLTPPSTARAHQHKK